MQKIGDIWLDDARHSPRELQNLPAVQLLGAPDDRGVRNVGGRLGAAQGPRILREFLEKMQVGINPGLRQIRFGKGQDIALGSTIEDAHHALRKQTRELLSADVFPIVVGGGHDLGFPHVAGTRDFFKKDLAVVNVDAHLDVRPKNESGITSGSPFYLAIENGALNPKLFHEFGIQEHCNAPEALEYLEKRGAEISLLNDLRKAKSGVLGSFEKVLADFSRKKIPTLVSFDLDAVGSAWAPGVSAPQADGFSSTEFLAMIRACARDANVRTIGFFELSPPLDESTKTTRLAATAVHQFISCFGLRAKKQTRPPSPAARARRGR